MSKSVLDNLIECTIEIKSNQDASINDNTNLDFKRKVLLGIETFEDFLFLSILEGEYYLKSCAEHLQIVEKNINDIKSSNNKNPLIDDKKLIDIQEMISDYKFLNGFILDRNADNFKTKRFNFAMDKKLFIKSDSDYAFSWLFSLNVRLAEIDEGYNSNDAIHTLYRFHYDLGVAKEIEVFTNKVSIIEQLNLKCSILLYKTLKRIQKTEDVEFSNYNDPSSISDIENEIKNSDIGKRIIQEINSHYFDHSHDIDQTVKAVKSSGSVKVEDVHKFTKLLKINSFSSKETDNYKNILKNLLSTYRNKLKNVNLEDHPYLLQGNEIAYTTTVNLVQHALFCLDASEVKKSIKNSFSFSTFDSGYKRLEKSFKKSAGKESEKAPNLMLYISYLETISSILEECDQKDKKILNEENTKFEGCLDKIFKDTYIVLKDFKKDLIRSKRFNLMPLYLEIQECSKNKFFLDSQYILPSNYNYLFLRLNEFHDKFKSLERINYYIIPDNIKESLKEVFKKEVKEHQYSVITIIGLYASFITYVLANVNVLPNLIKHSMGAVFAFMLILGVVLFFFVGTLKLLFSNNKKNWFLVWFIIGLGIVGLAFYYVKSFSNVGIAPIDQVNSKPISSDTTNTAKQQIIINKFK